MQMLLNNIVQTGDKGGSGKLIIIAVVCVVAVVAVVVLGFLAKKNK